jgi:23S rRNA (cytosine1962-C5)-methyltransferase
VDVDGRGARRVVLPARIRAREFDLVVLDPPTWATTSFGAVDLVRDYQSLFKPSVLATKPGGTILATNHVSTVDLDEWLESLQRCAAKAGRPLSSLEVLTPEADFPSPDGRHPLKVALATVGTG